MQSMYIVYGQNQMQRKHLEGEFLQNSGLFAVPFSHLKTLNDLIDKTCYQFYQKDESIFIQKLKTLITGIISFTFSFPLWREILTQLKRKDLVAENYRNYLISMDKYFLQEKPKEDFYNTDEDGSQKLDDQFQKVLHSYKSLDAIDLDEPISSFATFSQLEKSLKIPQVLLHFQSKINNYESEKTNDKTIKRTSKKSNCEIKSSHKIQGDPLSFVDSTPIKSIQNDFQAQLIKFSQSLAQTQLQSPREHHQLIQRMSKRNNSSEFNDFIDSFKKNRVSPVAQMIIHDQSFHKIVKKQKKNQKERKKLQQELYQKTKSVKSKQYNKNIKTILLNKRVKDKKKSGFEGQKSQISGVVGAYELRRVSSEIFNFDQQDNLKLFKSAGKSVFNFNK